MSIRVLPPDDMEPDPLYRAALRWVWAFSAIPRSAGAVLADRPRKLPRMRRLMRELNDVQAQVPVLLVGGTKGKGSTVAMMATALTSAGYRTGRYTSPHLVNWRERICVDGIPIRPEEVVALVPPVREAAARVPGSLGDLTTFEIGTALALLHFVRVGVDVAMVEVGVGGRHDATNVLDPLVSIVTSVSLDHTSTLGHSLSDIASAKSGIFRPGRTAVIAPQESEVDEVLGSAAAAMDARLVRIGVDWIIQDQFTREVADGEWSKYTRFDRVGNTGVVCARVALAGRHQLDNAACAIAALTELSGAPSFRRLDAGAMRAGLEQVEWPGRLQVLCERPHIVVDGAHNAASAEALLRATRDLWPGQRIRLVFGVTRDKQVQQMLRVLLPHAESISVTRANHPRAEDAAVLVRQIHQLAPGKVVRQAASVAQAMDSVVADREPGILTLVTGSLFVVGEALTWAAEHERNSLAL